MRIMAFFLLATACADEPAGVVMQGVDDVCENATIARVWIIDGSNPDRCPNRVHMVYSSYGTEHNEIKDLCVMPATTGIIKFSEEEAAMFSCIDDYGQLVLRYRNYDVQDKMCDVGYKCVFSDQGGGSGSGH
jgi:hypothetical protein